MSTVDLLHEIDVSPVQRVKEISDRQERFLLSRSYSGPRSGWQLQRQQVVLRKSVTTVEWVTSLLLLLRSGRMRHVSSAAAGCRGAVLHVMSVTNDDVLCVNHGPCILLQSITNTHRLASPLHRLAASV